MLLKPLIDVEVVVLFAPQHSGQRLAMHPALILVELGRRDPLVEFVRFVEPSLKYLVEVFESVDPCRGGQPQAYGLASSRRARRLRSGPRPWFRL